ncbi:lipid IV(A) 4-amino-4-deoxy-L-arabinosyltransferase [Veronia pacifica]|uniref:4-amino-4-deoxy-L-arabinose lipid A transferase n=1 Tax=Veronia pacifica TaxID=1080227 RepID=A0A1C3E9B7_9GAMM|nr:lipid IV(A) 4-amino-4-deoxy-L-arabinosyltransferase [Veronia pacifica]ODA29832.1 4-amino-4-deoxy-L-arabinose lipid A transferase [Veronia pacifica]
MNSEYKAHYWVILLLSYFIVAYLLQLAEPALWSPDELRYAEISREMVATGDWVVPHFNGLRYFEKPVMGYWLNALSQLVFGENNFAVRFASSISALGSALCLALLVSKETNVRQGWLTAGVYLSLFLVMTIGTYSVLDSMLSFWLTATFITFYFAMDTQDTQRRILLYLVAGCLCGCALLTKGFLALALPVIVVGAYAIWQRQLHQLLIYGWLTIIAATLICLPWALAIHQQEPDYWHYFFWIEHIKRFTADNAQHASPSWYYLPFLLLGILPWLFILPSCLSGFNKQYLSPLIRFALLWFLLPLVFFSLSKGKLVTYILPCMAPVAVLITHALVSANQQGKNLFPSGSLLHIAIALLLAVTFPLLNALGHLPLGPDEWYKPWLLTAAMVFWACCVLISKRSNNLESLVFAHMLAPLGLFTTFGPALPDTVIDSKLPERFIERLSEDISDQTIIVSDYPSNMSAFNWYLKRSDIYLTRAKGEVEYGLSYPDARQRFIPLENLSQFVQRKRKESSVVIQFRDLDRLSPEFPDGDFPKADKFVEQGRFQAFIFHRRPE